MQSCPSSTPFQNKTLKSQQNLAMRSLNKPNFVNGITAKLSPIVEISREEYSKSSSSSSGTMSNVTKKILISDNIDPFDSHNRKRILSAISDPVEFRIGYKKNKQKLPTIRTCQIFPFFDQNYLVMDRVNKKNDDDVNELYVCCRFPPDLDEITKISNESIKLCRNLDYWEFYICDELKRRLIQNNCGGPNIVNDC
ncbi:hypothetical protein BLA29_010960 [Euroglyphus maynei]|uniref:Uncharacterized protein n=1 Tax=Euroglyphus maynei TaxID=6958 RepID=A0A1Y3B9P7_EURMA|nr:hypothetical protein BLA29_010960 [Euroglyphus maynei]